MNLNNFIGVSSRTNNDQLRKSKKNCNTIFKKLRLYILRTLQVESLVES